MKNVEDIYPLSPTQAGMLFHTIQAPQTGIYIQQYTCTLEGKLDVAALAQAWQSVVDRHPVLRTAFIWKEIDQPLQVVRLQVNTPFEWHDWHALSPDEQRIQYEQFLVDDRNCGFDLASAPLTRINVMQIAPDLHTMVWSFHHLISDGWSTPLILKEVFAIYEASQRGREVSMPQLRPYRDYIAWLQQQDLVAAEQFWNAELAGVTGPTRLPMKHTNLGRKERAKRGYGEQEQQIPAGTIAALQRLAQEHRLTLNTLVQGAWALLLSRYSGDEEVIYGTTLSGRPAELQGVEEMIGMCICTLPMRVHVSPEDHLVPWLKAFQARQLNLRQYEYSPLTSVQRWSGLPPGVPLFESIVAFENYPQVGTEILGAEDSLAIRNVRYLEQSNYPLSLLVIPGNGLTIQITYDRDVYEDAAMERMLGHLITLLNAMARDPKQPLSALALLSEEERHQILVTWNETGAPYAQNRCIHHLIEDQVLQTPDATAAIFADNRLSYKELNESADRLAAYLRTIGVGPNVAVGLCLERSIEMLIAIVGVLKAGGAYVPLDPSHPPARLAFILEDTGAPVLLTQRKFLDTLPSGQAQVICIDTEGPYRIQNHHVLHELQPSPPSNTVHAQEPTSDCLAYIIYTSGSTGQPKGVPITHRNLVHSTTARFHGYPEPVKTFLLLSSFTFDSSVVGIFWTLCQGGTLLLPMPRQEQDVQGLAALIAQHQVTHTLCLPSLYNLILAYSDPAQLTSLQTVIVAGEACPAPLIARHYEALPQAALYNEYGPTEGTVWSTVFHFSAKIGDGPVPIGRPIANMQAYILDTARQPVPIGVPGELYIGGDGLASGYLSHPELTTATFVPHPFCDEPNARLYRTGDRACYRPDGNILYLGRIDDQIKLRGYRIEPGEIETVLAEHGSVETAVVVMVSAQDGATEGNDTGDLTALTLSVSDLGEEADSLLSEIETLTEQEAEAMLVAATYGRF